MKSSHKNRSSDLVKLLTIHIAYSMVMFEFTKKYIGEFDAYNLSFTNSK